MITSLGRPRLEHDDDPRTSQQVVTDHAANELVIGVVGHVGSGNSEVARQLQSLLQAVALIGGAFDVEILKASDEIRSWLRERGEEPPARAPGEIAVSEALQTLGDRCRKDEGDAAALARRLVCRIRLRRATKLGVTPKPAAPVLPDGRRRAWILDSLRNPSEVELLRHVYQDAFVLVGVVCDEERRKNRLSKKYTVDGSPQRVAAFMDRDAEERDDFGQRVAETFHISDFFVDNTEEKTDDAGAPNVHWDVADQLSRLIRILTHADIVRPSRHETAMHAAYGAQLRSACLSRQVGAALVSDDGELLATGSNEVPKPGGGVYGQDSNGGEAPDERCAFRKNAALRYCSNTREQQEIISDVVGRIRNALGKEGLSIPEKTVASITQALRGSRIGGLIEFSRAVHAEMAAILSAGRTGHCPAGSTLYVTTFPCHYCARHIVAAGVVEVQYIEPYPKSLASKLHDDSITSNPRVRELEGGGKRVLFRPFTGVAPRLYRRSFLKDRELKAKDSGEKEFGTPLWGSPWHLRRVSYVALEAQLTREAEQDDEPA